MPQRAPTYYHWSMDKPATTNQTYGYSMRNQVKSAPPKLRSLNDYTRPFSNSGFFPQLVAKKDKEAADPMGCKRAKTAMDGSKISFNINRGYTMGHTPIYTKVQKNKYPIGVNLDIATSVPSTFVFPQHKSKDLYLWHSLTGTLVHCKNHVPNKNADPYCVPKVSQDVY